MIQGIGKNYANYNVAAQQNNTLNSNNVSSTSIFEDNSANVENNTTNVNVEEDNTSDLQAKADKLESEIFNLRNQLTESYNAKDSGQANTPEGTFANLRLEISKKEHELEKIQEKLDGKKGLSMDA